MLIIKNVSKVYSKKNELLAKALDDVSMDFPDRGLVFILGKSGSGKSTLLNLIGGLDTPTSGEIVVDGRSSATFTESDFDNYRNTYIGFVFQEYNLIDNYTVGRNIGLALELQGKKADKEKIEDLLRRVELTDDAGRTFFDRNINELSGGQKQRVAIARALIKDPKIILADEPTGALDEETGKALYELLKKLSENKLVVVVTHDRESAEKYGDRIIEISDGKLTADRVINNKNLNDATTTKPTHLIKSRLPLKRYVTMGASGLKKKPFRLGLSVLLSVVAFIIFGFAFTASFADRYNTELNTLRSNDWKIVTLESENYDRENNRYPFSEKQLKTICEFNDLNAPMTSFYEGTEIIMENYLGEADLNEKLNPYIGLAKGLTNYVELDPVTGEKDALLKPDSRFQNENLCRLPTTFTEIAITDIRADMFINFGYKAEDGTESDIKTPDDLIGKKLGKYTICGVYSTEQNADYFRQYNIDNYGWSDAELALKPTSYNLDVDLESKSYISSAKNSIISYGFVCKGFRQSLGVKTVGAVLLKLHDSSSDNKELINKLNYTEDDINYSVKIISGVSNFINAAGFWQDYAYIPAIIAAIFTVFSILLMMNFISVSIDFRKHELGILRALGASKKDVITICLMESLTIALINFVISLIGVIIICSIFNAYYFVRLFIVGFIPILLLFLLCFGVAALATILPVRRLAKKKPVDIINNK